LWQLHQRGKLELDFSPLSITIGYHVPCHLRALGKGQCGESLLRLIPGTTVRTIDKGCSGMAGTWGLKASNFRRSLRVGWPLIQEMRKGGFDIGSTECSTCKMQMEQGTWRPTIHPIKILAYAYGLMPEIESMLTARGQDLVIT
jgi:Fe-S oxidoreductase